MVFGVGQARFVARQFEEETLRRHFAKGGDGNEQGGAGGSEYTPRLEEASGARLP